MGLYPCPHCGANFVSVTRTQEPHADGCIAKPDADQPDPLSATCMHPHWEWVVGTRQFRCNGCGGHSEAVATYLLDRERDAWVEAERRAASAHSLECSLREVGTERDAAIARAEDLANDGRRLQDERDIAIERAEDLETQLSTQVSYRDHIITDLRARAEAAERKAFDEGVMHIKRLADLQTLRNEDQRKLADAESRMADATAHIHGLEDTIAEQDRKLAEAVEALVRIGQWDCLNPPNAELCADHPWLRRLVDEALARLRGTT